MEASKEVAKPTKTKILVAQIYGTPDIFVGCLEKGLRGNTFHRLMQLIDSRCLVHHMAGSDSTIHVLYQMSLAGNNAAAEALVVYLISSGRVAMELYGEHVVDVP